MSDNGGFDNTQPGTYKVTFTVTDKDGARATKQADVTVQKKSLPPAPLHQQTRTVPQTGDTSVLPEFLALTGTFGIILGSGMSLISHKRRRQH